MRGIPRVVVGVATGAALYSELARRPPLPRPPRRDDRPFLARVATSAAAEELLWRHLLLRAAAARVGTARALAATSVGFALAHVPRAGLRPLQAYVGVGAALGAVAIATGAVSAAVAAHVAYDLLVVLDPRLP